MPLHVDLVSADRKVWSGQALSVIARTTEGDLGVLPGHEPTMALLPGGEVKISTVEGEVVIAVLTDGFLSVEHDRVTLVSETASLAGSPTS